MNFIADTLTQVLDYPVSEMLGEIIYKYNTHNFTLPTPLFHQSLLYYIQTCTTLLLQFVMRKEELPPPSIKLNLPHRTDRRSIA